MIKKVAAFIIFLSVFGVIVSKFLQKQNSASLNLVISNPIKSLDPAVAFNDDSLVVIGQALETLYQYHYLKRPYEIIPSLAASLPEISENGKVYRIKIKPGVRYQNLDNLFSKDRFVEAEDFIWQMKRLVFSPLKSNGTWLFEGKIKGLDEFSKVVGKDYNKFLTESVSGLRAIDKTTLEIELSNPEPNLLYFLAMTFTSPVPIEVIKKYNNDLSKVLIGTGPYQLERKTANSYIFKKNTVFHQEFYPSSGDRYANTQELLKSSKKELPFVEELVFNVIQSDDEKWKAFIRGDIDILNVPKKYLLRLSDPNSDINKRISANDIHVKHFSRQTSRWLGFNMNDPLVGKNKNLRFAIAHAIDFDRYLKLITNNTTLKANSLLNPSISGYRPSKSLPFKYDLEKAKDYLAKSGLTDGEIDLTYSTRGKTKIHFEEAEFLKDSLADIGINLKINPLEFSEFLKLGRSGKLQFWTDNWIYDYPDTENLLQLLITKNHPGINKSGFSNEKVDKLYEKIAVTLDQSERFRMMYEIEEIVDAELPWILAMYESSYVLLRKEVKNYRKAFFIRNHFKYIDKR